MASVFGTSSPSYPILASMDLARQWMEEVGAWEYQRVALRVAGLRQKFPSLRPQFGLSLDPCRFVLKVKDGPGFATSDSILYPIFCK